MLEVMIGESMNY